MSTVVRPGAAGGASESSHGVSGPVKTESGDAPLSKEQVGTEPEQRERPQDRVDPRSAAAQGVVSAVVAPAHGVAPQSPLPIPTSAAPSASAMHVPPMATLTSPQLDTCQKMYQRILDLGRASLVEMEALPVGTDRSQQARHQNLLAEMKHVLLRAEKHVGNLQGAHDPQEGSGAPEANGPLSFAALKADAELLHRDLKSLVENAALMVRDVLIVPLLPQGGQSVHAGTGTAATGRAADGESSAQPEGSHSRTTVGSLSLARQEQALVSLMQHARAIDGLHAKDAAHIGLMTPYHLAVTKQFKALYGAYIEACMATGPRGAGDVSAVPTAAAAAPSTPSLGQTMDILAHASKGMKKSDVGAAYAALDAYSRAIASPALAMELVTYFLGGVDLIAGRKPQADPAIACVMAESMMGDVLTSTVCAHLVAVQQAIPPGKTRPQQLTSELQKYLTFLSNVRDAAWADHNLAVVSMLESQINALKALLPADDGIAKKAEKSAHNLTSQTYVRALEASGGDAARSVVPCPWILRALMIQYGSQVETPMSLGGILHKLEALGVPVDLEVGYQPLAPDSVAMAMTPADVLRNALGVVVYQWQHARTPAECMKMDPEILARCITLGARVHSDGKQWTDAELSALKKAAHKQDTWDAPTRAQVTALLVELHKHLCTDQWDVDVSKIVTELASGQLRYAFKPPQNVGRDLIPFYDALAGIHTRSEKPVIVDTPV